MTTPALDRETILRAVRSWPPQEQITLIHEILEQVRVPLIEEPLQPPDSRALAGLLANGEIPPSDDDIARWLEEARMERYGDV